MLFMNSRNFSSLKVDIWIILHSNLIACTQFPFQGSLGRVRDGLHECKYELKFHDITFFHPSINCLLVYFFSYGIFATTHGHVHAHTHTLSLVLVCTNQNIGPAHSQSHRPSPLGFTLPGLEFGLSLGLFLGLHLGQRVETAVKLRHASSPGQVSATLVHHLNFPVEVKWHLLTNCEVKRVSSCLCKFKQVTKQNESFLFSFHLV